MEQNICISPGMALTIVTGSDRCGICYIWFAAVKSKCLNTEGEIHLKKTFEGKESARMINSVIWISYSFSIRWLYSSSRPQSHYFFFPFVLCGIYSVAKFYKTANIKSTRKNRIFGAKDIRTHTHKTAKEDNQDKNKLISIPCILCTLQERGACTLHYIVCVVSAPCSNVEVLQFWQIWIIYNEGHLPSEPVTLPQAAWKYIAHSWLGISYNLSIAWNN